MLPADRTQGIPRLTLLLVGAATETLDVAFIALSPAQELAGCACPYCNETRHGTTDLHDHDLFSAGGAIDERGELSLRAG